ncbi:hypothetical protein QJS10_CPA03g02159 [Acorus calamus]|uniref:DNA-directed RNA polymerase subunit n=1 Tax=Acorus calamus TaxID=4465 RepID=A0AAV9F9H2_ACOCL|nr:hypothetical protein QJS10_CPA03g02159 [Acorus calamus]
MDDVFRVADTDLIAYIHPSMANKTRRAIQRQLSSLLFTYNEAFDGMVLAYSIEDINKMAKILSGLQPYYGVNLKAKLLMFSPKPDMLLEGKIVRLERESIHVVVLGFCSASIMSENIREEFKYKSIGGQGVFINTSHKRHLIKSGSFIRFLVQSLDEEMLHISGSLIPANTGCIRWLSKHVDEDSQMERNHKRQREEDLESESHKKKGIFKHHKG